MDNPHFPQFHSSELIRQHSPYSYWSALHVTAQHCKTKHLFHFYFHYIFGRGCFVFFLYFFIIFFSITYNGNILSHVHTAPDRVVGVVEVTRGVDYVPSQEGGYRTYKMKTISEITFQRIDNPYATSNMIEVGWLVG